MSRLGRTVWLGNRPKLHRVKPCGMLLSNRLTGFLRTGDHHVGTAAEPDRNGPLYGGGTKLTSISAKCPRPPWVLPMSIESRSLLNNRCKQSNLSNWSKRDGKEVR